MFVHVETHANTMYERVGGQPFFRALVERFYTGVEHDPLLRPLYPDDLEPPSRHLALFLAQYWGGPHTYNDERGHPRLRMRHFPFRIGQSERDAWLGHMRAAVETSTAAPSDAAALLAYFETASTSLINQPR
jgi:hemoglobin